MRLRTEPESIQSSFSISSLLLDTHTQLLADNLVLSSITTTVSAMLTAFWVTLMTSSPHATTAFKFRSITNSLTDSLRTLILHSRNAAYYTLKYPQSPSADLLCGGIVHNILCSSANGISTPLSKRYISATTFVALL